MEHANCDYMVTMVGYHGYHGDHVNSNLPLGSDGAC